MSRSGDWYEMTVSSSLQNHSPGGGSKVPHYSSFDDTGFGSPSVEHHHHKHEKQTILGQYQKALFNFYAKYELYITTTLLIISTAGERVTFKFMIDHMYPFKFVLIEIIFLLSFILFSIVTLYKIHRTKEITNQMRSFPHKQIFLMAVLDSFQFLGLVYSGVNVSPTMTVILMHASTLFVVGGSRFVFPNRSYGDLHKYGVALMSAAIFISFCKVLWCDWSTSENDGYLSTRSAVIYILASALQGLSTLYKENSLVSWGQPVNIYYLTSFLFLYQFLTTVVLSIGFYMAKDLFGTHVPILSHMYYGWKCFLGVSPPKQEGDDDIPECPNSLYIIVGYVLSTFTVIMSINSVLTIGNRIVGRVVSGAVLAAFIVLWFYDFLTASGYHSIFLSCHVSVLDVLAIIVLLAGMEVYGQDPEPDVEIITNYPMGPSSPTTTDGMSEPVSPT